MPPATSAPAMPYNDETESKSACWPTGTGPAPFSTVCFRFRPSALKAQSGDARRRQACDEYLDRLNEAVLDAVNASGEAFLSHTKIRGRYAIRMAIGNINSDRAEVNRTWRLLRDEASRLDGEMRQQWRSAARIS